MARQHTTRIEYLNVAPRARGSLRPRSSVPCESGSPLTPLLAADPLADSRPSVVCAHCGRALYLMCLINGTRAYSSTCGCRLRALDATRIEHRIRTALAERVGVRVPDIFAFLLRQEARCLLQVRVGFLPEEVTCIWR